MRASTCSSRTSRPTAACSSTSAPSTDIYLPRVDWFPDSRGIAVQRQSRDQKTLELLRFDALTGRGRVLLTEHSEHWVPLHRELTFLQRTPQFIWASSRDGFQHLYLYGNDGNLIRQLTSGEFMVVGESPESAIRAVDERARRVYFTANLPSPLERQLYWVSLDQPGDAATRDRGRGLAQRHHVAGCARVRRHVFERGHAAQRHAAHGRRPRLISDAVPTSSMPRIRTRRIVDEHVRAEFGTIAAADGQTMHYRLLKPRHLEAGQALSGARRRLRRPRRAARHQRLGQPVPPVPGAARLRRVHARQPRQRIARRAFRDRRSGGRMGDVEVQDQVRGVEFLRSLPFVDAKRIGIFGWSYGGYMTLMCLMQAPDAFAAGVAGAPVTDWALYDTHYTERYLSTPQANAGRLRGEQRARRTRTSCSGRCCWCTAWPTTTCCSRTARRS